MAEGKLGNAVDRMKSAVGRDEGPTARDAEGRVAVVRSALRAWGEGELDGFFGALDDKVEWVAPQGSKFPANGTINGRDELRKRLTGEVEDAYQDFGFRPQHFLEAEDVDWVVVLGAFVGAPLKGTDLDVPGVMVWELDGDEAKRIRVYTDSDLFHEPAPDAEEEKREREERERGGDGRRGEKGERSGGEDREGGDGPRGENEGRSDDETREREGEDREAEPARGGGAGERSD